MITASPLTIHHLQVQATATAPLELRRYTGASLRGAFFGTLWGNFCVNKDARTCAACPLVQICPVSALVAPLRDEAVRGRDVPRPYAIRPPIHHAEVFGPGENFTFGLTLFGSRVELFPYVAMAFTAMGQRGIGRRVPENSWERGQFRITSVAAINLLTGAMQTIMTSGNRQVEIPARPITWADAEARAATLSSERLTLNFLTPLRLTDQKQLVKRPYPRPLVARLLERHDALAVEYGGAPFDAVTRAELLAAAEAVQIAEDQTSWVDLTSFSHRQHRSSPIGGLIGTTVYIGDLRRLRTLLVWGAVLQIGKDTTKGNGMYTIT